MTETPSTTPSTTTPTTGDAKVLKGSEEAEQVLKIYHPTIGDNEQWAILDARWYQSWARYSGIDTDRKSVTVVTETGAPRPGPVDNTSLQSPVHPLMLKMGLNEGLDYVLVHIDVWNRYMEWYGGGPPFVRTTITQGIRRTVRVEMYPVFLSLMEVKKDAEDADESTAKVAAYSTRLTIKEIIQGLLPEKKAEDKKEKEGKEGETPTGAPGGATGTTTDDKEDKNELPIRVWQWLDPEENKEATSSSSSSSSVAAPGGPATTSSTTSSTTPSTTSSTTPSTTTTDPSTALVVVPTSTSGSSGDSKEAPVVPKRKKDNWKLIEGLATLTAPLEGLGLPKDKVIKVLVERRKDDGTWPRAAYVKDWRDFEAGDTIDCCDTVGKWYETQVKEVKEDSIHCHFVGWADSWDEWVSKTSPRLAKKNTHTTGPRVKPVESSWSMGWSSSWGSSEEGRPPVPGAVGLRNLGNTCFMNSTLACLSHSPIFTEFFLDGTYEGQINRDNPLGWKGKVAEEYGAMTREVWSDKYSTVAPRKFKEAIGQFAPRFSGYQQQDSSELLGFLLDGLHEDLNRVLKKPATAPVESKGRPDAEVAEESWVNYKKRNDSMVVDYIQGQLKSRLQCPIEKCNKISITFDPFTFISAPLPTIVDKVQEVALVHHGSGKGVVIYGCTVSTVGRIADLKKALSELSGVAYRRLVVVEIWNHRIYRFMDDDTGLSEIRPNDHIFAYEVPQLEELKGEGVPIQIIHQRLERNPTYDKNYTHSREFLAEAFGLPRVFALPRRSTTSSHDIRAIIDGAVAGTKPSGGGSPFRILALHNDARNCLKCGYAAMCTGCDAPDDEKPIDIGEGRESRAAFAIQWENKDNYNLDGDRVTRDKSADISLTKKEATVDLGDCLNAFTKQETLSETDPWYCSDCKEHRQAYKKFDIYKLPNILVIHLKRFSYTRLWRDKISTFVDFPVDGLDMSKFCASSEYKGEKGLYDLYGVSNHMGNMGGGHYNAYVRNLYDDKWYCHDDSRVYPVNVTEIKSSSAYVLFYKRRDCPKPKRHISRTSTSTSSGSSGSSSSTTTTESKSAPSTSSSSSSSSSTSTPSP